MCTQAYRNPIKKLIMTVSEFIVKNTTAYFTACYTATFWLMPFCPMECIYAWWNRHITQDHMLPKFQQGLHYRLILHCRKWRNQRWHWVWLTLHDSINTPVSWSASVSTGERRVPIPSKKTIHISIQSVHLSSEVRAEMCKWSYKIMFCMNDTYNCVWCQRKKERGTAAIRKYKHTVICQADKAGWNIKRERNNRESSD